MSNLAVACLSDLNKSTVLKEEPAIYETVSGSTLRPW